LAKVSQPEGKFTQGNLDLGSVRSESSSEEAFGVETWKDLKGFSSVYFSLRYRDFH
jgi:hypothetical protein